MAKTVEPKQIGLFLPPTLGYFGDVVLGIQEYARSVGNWVVEVCPTIDIARATCESWVPDGVLVSGMDGDWRAFLPNLNTNIVQIGGHAIEGVARVSTDNFAIGRTAAEHFLERGLRRFAFCGYDQTDWSDEREAGFGQVLSARGLEYIPFRGKLGEIFAGAVTGSLAAWVRSLPKPCAIFACHDRAAMLLANACAYLKVHVPEEVAILGVDNDQLECGFAWPPISSILGSARRVGFEGAVLLDELMRGATKPEQSFFVPPAGVAVRQSTDVLATDDADLRAALRFIREHATDAIDVPEVVNAVLISRRKLERKFRDILNRTPHEEILRARTAHAKMLLLSTRLSVLEIGLQCGFPSASKFSTVFTREVGVGPKLFRRLYSTRSAADPADHRGTVM
ncbi:MAG TPA: DNA-binding transcriptional regulator [Tepidisphaeraceae bacterium]|jgi:LacI family transcriptional regulator|nr:DNA-binding transcriptional regulator [Tepidisphaeraceae bacterium]